MSQWGSILVAAGGAIMVIFGLVLIWVLWKQQ